MNLIQTLLAFLFALGPLIIFHELGHYLVARLCGVKVLRFSLGMGKVVFSRRFGPDQTEWVISALPLGGYVKMLDSREADVSTLSEAELKREFTRQSVWRRIAIVAAGPLANFLLAILLFAGLFMHGMEEPVTRVRVAVATSPAYQDGLRSGDTIRAVNGKAIQSWSELRWEVVQAIVNQQAVRLDVDGNGGGSYSVYLPADVLARLDVESDVLGKLGIELGRPPAILVELLSGGPAAHAGLQVGDRIEAVDGKPVADGPELRERISAAPGKRLDLALLRGGDRLHLPVTPRLDTASKEGRIDVKLAPVPTVMISFGPLEALAKATRRTWETSVLSIKMIGKMITGEVSIKNVTGPITIADYAGQTARLGPTVYLGFIAFISISLGVMNLLPIPVLDGGLLLYYSLEVLTGHPLPERVGEYAQRLGLGLLVMLMALAVFNDVARLL